MTDSKNVVQDERRQYFRIKNHLFMGYELFDPNATNKGSTQSNNSLPFAHLMEELNSLSEANKSYCQTLNSQQQATIDHLNFVNDKIEKLTGYMIESLNLAFSDLLEVDLSGGGIRFESDTALTLGQSLKLELVLVPEYHYLVALGEVVDCLEENNQFHIAISFKEIQEADRDAVIRHVFKRQSQQLREQKQNQHH